MIKVNFKKPSKFWININSNDVNNMTECLFCFTMEPIVFLDKGLKVLFSKEIWDYQIFSWHEIKSIEHVKPTDL